MKFKAKFIGVGPKQAWTFMKVPFSVEKAWGTRGQVRVRGTLNGFPYRSSIFPDGKGGHQMMVNKAMQQGAGAKPGDTMKVVMELDAEPRTVTAPADLRKALAKNARAKAAFEKLAYSHKKEYVDWIEEAKRAETRAARIDKTLGKLVVGKGVKR